MPVFCTELIFIYQFVGQEVLHFPLHTVKENAEALVVATKEIGLEVNADITKYMIMSGDQNAGQVTV